MCVKITKENHAENAGSYLDQLLIHCDAIEKSKIFLGHGKRYPAAYKLSWAKDIHHHQLFSILRREMAEINVAAKD